MKLYDSNYNQVIILGDCEMLKSMEIPISRMASKSNIDEGLIKAILDRLTAIWQQSLQLALSDNTTTTSTTDNSDNSDSNVETCIIGILEAIAIANSNNSHVIIIELLKRIRSSMKEDLNLFTNLIGLFNRLVKYNTETTSIIKEQLASIVDEASIEIPESEAFILNLISKHIYPLLLL